MKDSTRNLIDYLESKKEILTSLLFLVIVNTFTFMITSNIVLIASSLTVIVAAFLVLTFDEVYWYEINY